jgi:integrase/recombinase XerD
VELEQYFTLLVEGYSWSTVKLDRLGLMFFWKHLEKNWQWPNIVKVPKVKTILDILTREEIGSIFMAAVSCGIGSFCLPYSIGSGYGWIAAWELQG